MNTSLLIIQLILEFLIYIYVYIYRNSKYHNIQIRYCFATKINLNSLKMHIFPIVIYYLSNIITNIK